RAARDAAQAVADGHAIARAAFCASVVAAVLELGLVAPAMAVKAMPSVLLDHWYASGAAPSAVTLNVAALPSTTLWSAGWVTTVGTVSGGGGASALPPQAASARQMPASTMRRLASPKPGSETGRSRVWMAFMGVGPFQNECCTARPSVCRGPRVVCTLKRVRS